MLNNIALGGRKPLNCEFVSDGSKFMYLNTLTAEWMMKRRGVVVMGVSKSGGLQIGQRRQLQETLKRWNWSSQVIN